MDTLRVMVKSIIIIIFMAAFLEIVLPRSDMKRYINLIIGLFVIVAVLNPFVGLINKDFSFDIFEKTAAATNSDTEALIRRGQEIGSDQKNEAAKQYKEKLSRQIAAFSRLYPNAGVSGVEIEMVEDPADPNFGQMKRIILHTGRGGGSGGENGQGGPGIRDVEINSVIIDSGKAPGGSPNAVKSGEKSAELKEVIASFYGLTQEQIKIQN